MARVALVVLFLVLTGSAATLSWYGVMGDSSAVISTRAGSAGGGYGIGGRVK